MLLNSNQSKMEVRPFQERDIPQASRMTYDYWSGELPDNSRGIKQVIYEYMVSYYDRNRELSFCVTVAGELKGFLLAFQKSDNNQNRNWLLSELERFNPEERKLALEYDRYYQYNGTKTKEYLAESDAILGLFVSTQKGCGEQLLNRFFLQCKQKSIHNVYLWTDMSCNYNYYYRNNFEEVTHFTNKELFDGDSLETIIFKKQLN